jgi:hypothetical protein
MPSIKEMFPSRYMSFEDFPAGTTYTGTIKSVVLEQAVARGFGGGGMAGQAQAVEPSWLLYFHEYPKPMKLKKTKAEAIAILVGSSKTEDWVGKRIGFYRGVWQAGGASGEGLMIDSRPLPPERQITSSAQAEFALMNRRIPADAIGRFRDTIAGQGQSWDDFLRWLKQKDTSAFAAAWGVEVSEIDAAFLPLMKAFLDFIHNPPARDRAEPKLNTLDPAIAAAKPAQGPLAGTVVDENDIPF